MNYETLCRICRPFKGKVSEKESERLESALDFLEVDATAEQTRGVARITLILGLFVSYEIFVGLTLLLGFSPLWFIFMGFPILLYIYLKRYPILKAESEKKGVLGEMPRSMSYLIMSLRINPNLERAIEFAHKHSSGMLQKKLKRIISKVRTGQGDAEEGLTRLAEEFKKWDEFKRCVRLVIASTLERSEEGRQGTLDKASDVLLGGLAARTEREARALNTPVMLVFTFGVILPLIFVAIIPFMSLMGIRIDAPTIAVLYTIALPMLLFIMIKFIGSNRPITMRAPEVPKKEKRALIAIGSLVFGLLLSLPYLAGEALGSMEYIPVLWGVGAGIGIFLLLTNIKIKKIRKSVKEMENSFSETLHQLGVILSEGKPLEDALRSCDSEFLKQAAMNIQGLNTDLRSAFFDKEFGSLKDVYSDTVGSVIDIIISISDKGSETMAKASFRMAEHINDLKKSEAEIERSLGGVVSSMRIIAMVVAPLVGGMISSMSVVLADTLTESQGTNIGFSGEAAVTLDPSLITLIIGIYAMESAAILVMFGTDLIHGKDKVMKRYSIGLALPIAIFVFTVCGFIANSLFASIA